MSAVAASSHAPRISPLFFWPDEDIVAKTALMLVLAAIAAALALAVEPPRRLRTTSRV